MDVTPQCKEHCFDVFTGELTPELERQQQQYEDWLLKHGNYLEMQVKALEQQIGKCKRTKKAINARNRQVKMVFYIPHPSLV